MLAQRVEVDIIACRDDFMAARLEVWVETRLYALNVRRLFRVDFMMPSAHQMRACFALWTVDDGSFVLIFQIGAIVTLLSKAQPKPR
jgi:hypothetical protein